MSVARFHRSAVLQALALLVLISLRLPVFGQDKTSTAIQTAQSPAGPGGNVSEPPFTLTVAVHEIVVSVVAVDSHNRPVTDLQPAEFQIFEIGKRLKRSPQPIASFHVIDPAMPRPIGSMKIAPFRIRSNEGCAIGSRTHYELAFHPTPGGLTPGYHDILITTSRPHVRLLFRTRYYVGETRVLSAPDSSDDTKSNAELQVAACYHPLVPPSLRLNAEPLPTIDTSARFSLTLQADSLASIPRSGAARQVQLDLGICTFDADGLPLNYMHTSIERVLAPPEYQESLAHGLHEQLELPTRSGVAIVRFVVRDHYTGNLGTLTMAIPNPARDALATAQSEERIKLEENRAQADIARKGYLSALNGPIQSFGSIVPQPGAMCGDVYELPVGTPQLPDFWSLQPIGTIYAYELDVPGQNVKSSSAIPGVTPKIDGFAIDYYGEFNIKTAGDYGFQLIADDSAKLYIDDHLIVNLDWLHDTLGKEATLHLDAGTHTLHLPYMDSIGGLALMLLIKPPGGAYRVFNLQDFSLPQSSDPPGAQQR